MASNAHAWWCNPHMFVAGIAQNDLDNNTTKWTEPLISYLSDSYPLSTTFEEAACWADDLKDMGVMANEEWHFSTFAVVQEAIWQSVPAVRNDSEVVWAIGNSINVLKSSKAVMQDKSRYLAFLIHFVGDLHQPLHLATMFSREFTPPIGDRGGNFWTISGEPQKNLHMFWDSGLNLWDGDQERPLNSSTQAWVDQWVSKITTQYPRSSFTDELKQENPRDWVSTAYQYALSNVYTTPVDGTPSEAYINAGRDVAMRQVAIAGYRLADILNSFDGDKIMTW
jgi:hypothetical protein